MNRTSLLLATALILAACGDSSTSSAGTADVGADIAADTGSRPTPDVVIDADGCPGVEPGVDSDEDGLEDALEDQNLNCVVDEDETDPHDPDTDGDGLLDGQEDVDHNGQWDAERGELDPRREDTDGDGVPDADERVAAVCQDSLLERVEASRVALGPMDAAYVDPSWSLVVAEDTGAALVLREGDDEVDPAAALLISQLETEADPGAWRDELLAALMGEAEAITEREWISTDFLFWRMRYRVSLATLPWEVVSSVAAAVGIEMTPVTPPDTPPPVRDWVVSVEVELDEDGRPAGRAAVSVALEEDTEWLRRTGVSAIAPRELTRIRAMCEMPAATSFDEVDVVMVLDPTPLGEATRSLVLDAVDGFTRARLAEGRTTRLWAVATDAHRYGATGALLFDEPLQSTTEIEGMLLNFASETPDGRVWLNARASLAALVESERVGEHVLLVVASADEDAEFRAGMYEGRDGDPFEAALEAGEERDALTQYYIDSFEGFGARIVALSSGTRAGAACDGFVDARDPGESFRDIALGVAGVFHDFCAPDAAGLLRDTLDGIAGPGPVTSLSRAPIRGTVRVANESGEISGDALTDPIDGDGGAAVRLPVGTDTTDIGAAYLFWEPPPSSELRR